jgi:hypothetical protein
MFEFNTKHVITLNSNTQQTLMNYTYIICIWYGVGIIMYKCTNKSLDMPFQGFVVETRVHREECILLHLSNGKHVYM